MSGWELVRTCALILFWTWFGRQVEVEKTLPYIRPCGLEGFRYDSQASGVGAGKRTYVRMIRPRGFQHFSQACRVRAGTSLRTS